MPRTKKCHTSTLWNIFKYYSKLQIIIKILFSLCFFFPSTLLLLASLLLLSLTSSLLLLLLSIYFIYYHCRTLTSIPSILYVFNFKLNMFHDLLYHVILACTYMFLNVLISMLCHIC